MILQFGLIEATVTRIRSVLAKYPEVEKAIIYGSRAKGNFKPGSDIDLTLVGPAVTTRHLYAITQDLDDLLLPYSFDLSVFNDIQDPDVVDHIKRVGVAFYYGKL